MTRKYITGKTNVQKAVSQQAQKKRKTLEILKTFVSTCCNHPEVYQNPQLSFFCQFVSEVSNDPKKYPPAISATTMMHDKNKVIVPELTKSFVNNLHKEYYPNLKSNIQPFVKVIEVYTIFKTVHFDNSSSSSSVT